MHTERTNFLDINFDRLTFEKVLSRLHAVTRSAAYGYVVTPNVDHVVRIERDQSLRAVWEGADLCLCDSRVIRLLARLRGIRLPLVPGSDLTAALFAEVIRPGDVIAVVGSSPEIVSRLRADYPQTEFLHHEPPMGVRERPDAIGSAATFIATAKPRFTLLAVGSPQQEIIASEVRKLPDTRGMALCIGAGLDFITGEQKRAPRALQRLGLEWAHRLATNPRRLWRRYLVEGPRIFMIYAKWRSPSRRRRWPAAALMLAGVAIATIYVGASRSREATGPGSATMLPEATKAQQSPLNLPPPDLLRPLTPGEAAKENAERPFVNRPDTAAGKFVLKADVEDRDRAITCLTQAVYYEAASEGVDGGRAVAQVVLNRLRHPGYPASVCGVVYQGAERATGCQFTFACDGSLGREPVAALWSRSRKIAEDALSGKVFAAVGHSTHYHADYVLPYWADSLDKTVKIGRHIFYRLRSSLGDPRSFLQHYAGSEPSAPKPAVAVVLAPSPESAKLADVLISDDSDGSVPDVEKIAQPGTSLVADASHGTLIADGVGPAAKPPKAGAAGNCPAADDGKAGARVAADVRSSGAPAGC